MPDEKKILHNDDQTGEAARPCSDREQTASALPFVLRAWWLRDTQEYNMIAWPGDDSITTPLWSVYSDPLCDAGNLDYSVWS